MRLRKEVCLFLLITLALIALFSFDPRPVTPGPQTPMISIADGGQPPPPPWPTGSTWEAAPVFIADGGQPPPPLPPSAPSSPALAA